tara:strand:+ start:3998 stop:4255 length:258 start_codon:yes stop_codon:yes gene_type:complete
MIKVILLNDEVLIGKIEEVTSELGEPDCKIVKPFRIKEYADSRHTMEPWLSNYTDQDLVMLHSDKILTIVEPKQTLIDQYESLIK